MLGRTERVCRVTEFQIDEQRACAQLHRAGSGVRGAMRSDARKRKEERDREARRVSGGGLTAERDVDRQFRSSTEGLEHENER